MTSMANRLARKLRCAGRVALPLLFLLALASPLHARAGGGGSYSGGGGGGGGYSGGGGGGWSSSGGSGWSSSDGSSSSYSGDGDVGLGDVITLGFIVVVVVIFLVSKKKNAALRSAGGVSRPRHDPLKYKLEALRRVDPNFSRVLFLDFAHQVYVKLHESRGGLGRKKGDTAVAPYLEARLRQHLLQDRVQVSHVVVGATRILDIQIPPGPNYPLRVVVEFESNLDETLGGHTRRLYLHQLLTFSRPLGVHTRAPEKVLELGCPSCGSPEEPDLAGRCPSCGAPSAAGRSDWQVTSVHTRQANTVGPPVGASGGVEVGTNLPTVIDAGLPGASRRLHAEDPTFRMDAFLARVGFMFTEIQEGWSRMDESRIRPFETDTIFGSHRYWLERYREQGQRNVLEGTRVERIDLARIEHDAWYDSITVRIFASMKDYTVDRHGKVLSGSNSAPRRFSEYWTLIRRSGRKHHESRDPKTCPNCGAALDKVNQAGVCEYCNSKIVSGEFDWVLALITQDEEYTG